ncbi:hypothetical protein RB594_001287 [Gaeumannomyces avenae]
MKPFTLLASAALTALASLPLATGASIPSYIELHHTSRRELSHAQATERYDIESRPEVRLVVVPGAEFDISTIVKLANALGVPFMVENRDHALASTGGTYGKQVIDYLWGRGYVTVTGSCDCGLYGRISDNFVNLNVVLANGSAIGVNATSHPDLWWGMQGAGHNFGIVTSFQSKIYPKKVDTWHYHSYTFTQDKLESLFEALSVLHGRGDGSTPALMAANFGMFQMVPSISQTEVGWPQGGDWSFKNREVISS